MFYLLTVSCVSDLSNAWRNRVVGKTDKFPLVVGCAL